MILVKSTSDPIGTLSEAVIRLDNGWSSDVQTITFDPFDCSDVFSYASLSFLRRSPFSGRTLRYLLEAASLAHEPTQTTKR